jgi:hypothetical protein
VYDAAGEPQMIVRLPVAPIRVDDALRARVRAEMLDGVPADSRELLSQLIRDMPFADVVPPFDGLKIATNGDLWVRRAVMSWDSTQTWLHLNESGSLAHTLRLSIKQLLHEAGADYLLVEERDVVDVPRIRLFRYKN